MKLGSLVYFNRGIVQIKIVKIIFIIQIKSKKWIFFWSSVKTKLETEPFLVSNRLTSKDKCISIKQYMIYKKNLLLVYFVYPSLNIAEHTSELSKISSRVLKKNCSDYTFHTKGNIITLERKEANKCSNAIFQETAPQETFKI